MSSKEVVFADRLVGLSIHNGLVRMDLAVVTGPAKGKDGKPGVKMETRHQVVLPLDGFAASFDMQQKLVKELATRQKKRRDAKSAVDTPAVVEVQGS